MISSRSQFILISLIVVALYPWSPCISQTASVDFMSGLKRMKEVSRMPEYFERSEVKQVSSYDRTGGNDDGFSGKYSFLRKEKNGHLVIFDETGGGVIERIWTPTPTDDTLDFYFDGASSATFSIRFRDLFTGTVMPFITPLAGAKVGGFYSYIPIPYKKGCKIVLRGEKLMFLQIQFRQLNKNYDIKSFTNQITADEKSMLKSVAALWQREEQSVATLFTDKAACYKKELTLVPGDAMPFASFAQGGRILGIEIMSSKIFEGLHKQVDIRITWDGEKQPAINIPVADFFGYAFGERSMNSMLLGSTPSKLFCYLPMPFDKAAKMELVYRKNESMKDQPAISLETAVYHSTQKRDPAKEGKLYAFWNSSRPALGAPHIFLEGSGKGHYVGTLLQSQATEFTNFTEFFEGDDSTVIDGKNNIHGTGSEDYFNGGWYAQPGGWVEKLGAPLHGCLDYSLPFSRTGGYRFYITDKLPFSKNIFHSMEHGPERNNREVWYTSVAFYYAGQPVSINAAPENLATTVFQPDTVTFYTRLMQHLTYNGSMILKDGNAVLMGNDNAVMNISVNELKKGKYKIYLHQDKVNDSRINVNIAAGREASGWKTISLNNNDVYVGDVDIYDPGIPVSVLFKKEDEKNRLTFNRVMLIRN